MEFGLLTYGTAALAGTLSTLSPCVLPILPILIGSAMLAHRFGVIALAIGLSLSFTVIGVFIASIGVAIGFDGTILRYVASTVLMILGLVLLSPAAQAKLASLTSGVSDAGNRLLDRFKFEGLLGQFAIGLLLGLVWTPCVGPTLGTAITLASQGSNIFQVTVVMVLFGIGAAAPLVILGTVSRQTMMRVRGKLMSTGHRGKQILGVALVVVALMILTGFDKTVETWFTDMAPAWWIELTTKL